MDAESFRNKIVKGFAWQGLSRLLVQSLSWAGTIVVARLLSPEDYGIMAVAGIFIWILQIVIEMGLAQGLIQKREISTEEESGVFWLSVLTSMAAYAGVFVVAPHIAAFYSMPVLTDVLRVAGLVLLLASVKTVPLSRIMREMNFRYRALVDMTAVFASTATVVAMALNGFGVWSLVGGSLANHSITALGYLPALGRVPSLRFSLRRVWQVVRYGLHVMAGNLAYTFSSRSDVFVLGKILGEKLTGYYALAFQLSTIPLDKIGTIFNHVAFPSFSRAQEQYAESQSLFLQLHRYLLIVAMPLLLGLAVVAHDAVTVLLTEKWLPIVPVMQALCLVNVLRVSGMLMTPTLNARGRVAWTLRYNITGLVVLPTAFVLGAQLGLLGVALAWAVGYPLLYAMLARFMMMELGIRPSMLIRSAGSAVVSSAAMVTAVFVVQWTMNQSPAWARLFASVGAGGLAYIGTFVLLFTEQVQEVRNGLSMLRRGRAPEPAG